MVYWTFDTYLSADSKFVESVFICTQFSILALDIVRYSTVSQDNRWITEEGPPGSYTYNNHNKKYLLHLFLALLGYTCILYVCMYLKNERVRRQAVATLNTRLLSLVSVKVFSVLLTYSLVQRYI